MKSPHCPTAEALTSLLCRNRHQQRLGNLLELWHSFVSEVSDTLASWSRCIITPESILLTTANIAGSKWRP